jgi:phage terminase large subunit
VDGLVKLDLFKPRSYQLPIFDAIENKSYKRVLAILPRRAGKDVCGFNLMVRAALRTVGVYYYIFPTFAQAKRVIWDSITNEGKRFLDYIPQELVKQEHSQEMKIRLINGSLIQLVGSDNYDALMGTNPRGVVFSEYALQDPRAYQYIRPILTANNGWALFLSTPRGKNHLYELYQIANHSPEWFSYKLTIDDTQHIPAIEIEREKAEGIMSEDLIQQEYYTSFSLGVEGSYYAKYLDRMRLKGQIGVVPWEPNFKVHTSWDLGIRDATSIIFFQVVGQVIRVIDCYENSKEGLEHYIKILQGHPYTYGKHIAPHDIAQREFSTGQTRLEKARQLGISFIVSDKHKVEDGIESVRSNFSKMWIDEKACAPLIKALGNYRQEYDVKKKIYQSHPLHDWSSHYADSARYLCMNWRKCADGTNPETLDKRYREAYYGETTNMPSVFRDDLPPY